MEKLIELLNEYKGKEEWTIECDVPHNDWYSEYAYEHEELIIISKKYGFIKWLVENEKIDIESYCRITSIERKGEKDVYRDEVDSLLMLLSIKDNPIEFLVSILK